MNILKTIGKGLVETFQHHKGMVGVATTILTVVGIKGIFKGVGSMISGYVSDGTDHD